MKHSATYIAAILLAIGATGPVNAAIYTPPQIMVEKANVQYITGGIGKDEVAQVRQLGRKHDFNVQLTFAWNTGNFLADIPVTITDARGNPVFTLEKSDPVLMLRLPAGRYSLPKNAPKLLRSTKRRPWNSDCISHQTKATPAS